MTAILAREVLESLRSRWFLAVTLVFCGLALGISYLSFAGASSLGFAGFNRTVASLLNLVLLFVPLMGLVLGALGISGEREDGTLGYLLAQPVSRAAVYASKLAGQCFGLTAAIAVGLGLAGALVASKAGSGDAAAYGILALASMLLGAATLGTGVLAAVASGSRMRALAAAMVLWVLFAFALDAVSVALVVSGTVGPRGLFWVSLANPVQAAKVLCLLGLSAKLEVLGPSGIYAVRTFGQAGAWAVLSGALVAWMAVPAAAGYFLFRRMDVR